MLVHEVPGLPLRTGNGNPIGPTILDMLVRGVRRVEDLPPPAQKTVRAAGKARPPREVIAWSVRALDTLWPKPGEEPRRAPHEPDEEGEGCEAEHPFVPGLVSGGTPRGTASGGRVRVRKYSTCQIGGYIHRVASGMRGGSAGAYGRVAGAATRAWEADRERALQPWGSPRHRARRTGGAVLPFDARSTGKLREILESVATLAVGGVELLQERRRVLPAAALLLQHLSDGGGGGR